MDGMSGSNPNTLQRTRNCLELCVTDASCLYHIRRVLEELLWLPVRARISFKVATLVHEVRKSRQPSYRADLIDDYRQGVSLRSSSTILLKESPMIASTGRSSFLHFAAEMRIYLSETIVRSI